MRRRLTVVTVAVAVLLVSPMAFADYGSWPALARILGWLAQIDRTLKNINSAVDDVKYTVEQVYPDTVLRRIETFFDPVDSIKDEVDKLACGWRFTPRIERLHLALFGGRSFCRADWDLLFGTPAPMIDADLESYYELAYTPASTTYDGRFRSVQVKVKRRGVDVQSRSGYFALPPSDGAPLLPYEMPMTWPSISTIGPPQSAGSTTESCCKMVG